MSPSESEDEPLELYPPWREAVRRFEAQRFAIGQEISHAWLHAAFGLEMPLPTTPMCQGEPMRLAYVNQFGPFRHALLVELNVDLKSKAGYGYVVIEPSEQTREAMEDGERELRKATAKMVLRAVHVNREALTPAQQVENREAIARASMLAEMIRSNNQRRLPPPTEHV